MSSDDRSSGAPRVRIAPSPTGFFHVGGARTALYNWAIAKQQGGTFVLRIEDTDLERNQAEAVTGIIDALAWLGIDHRDPAFEGPYRQSSYADAHLAAAARLYETGHAYYCDLTPEQIQERAKLAGKPGYDGYSRTRGLGPGPGHVLRFRVPEGGVTVVRDLIRGDVTFEHEHIDDFVLLRGNGTPMFLLANVVDDVEMRISHVVRGEEHLPNTPKQQLMWEALGHRPPVWAHVPVLVNEKRQKLSKRRDKVALEQYRDEGYLASAMTNYLMTLGWAPRSVHRTDEPRAGHRSDERSGDSEIVSWSEIEATFRLEDVTHSPAFFDLKKLAAFNGEYIRRLSVDDFVAACAPWLPTSYDPAVFAAMAPHVQTRVVTLAEAPAMVDFLMVAEPEVDEAAWTKAMNQPWSRAVLAETVAAYGEGAWDVDTLKSGLEGVATRHGLKLGKAQAPVRVAVTGRAVGPPLFESLEVLGRDETIRRLDAAVARLPVGPGAHHTHPAPTEG